MWVLIFWLRIEVVVYNFTEFFAQSHSKLHRQNESSANDVKPAGFTSISLKSNKQTSNHYGIRISLKSNSLTVNKYQTTIWKSLVAWGDQKFPASLISS